MIRRLYVHNFRCLDNFELNLSSMPSVLLIGKNGSGKTAVGLALEILQKIGRGKNRVGDFLKARDFARGRTDVPMRFEIEVILGPEVYVYVVAFELSRTEREILVLEEALSVDGLDVYRRNGAETNLLMQQSRSALRALGFVGKFPVDRHLVALPIIEEHLKDAVGVFRRWLARALVLRPIPPLMGTEAREITLEPAPRVTRFGAWFDGVLRRSPAAYLRISEYLRQLMPDFQGIQRPTDDSTHLMVRFAAEQASMAVRFEDLSDGEKCFMVCALVLAANEAYGPLLCFWDEPDNYLALDEVQHFVMALRRAFETGGGQFIATSHNPEAIRSFSDENTLVLQRRSHLEPTIVRKLGELQIKGDLVGAMIRGDLG